MIDREYTSIDCKILSVTILLLFIIIFPIRLHWEKKNNAKNFEMNINTFWGIVKITWLYINFKLYKHKKNLTFMIFKNRLNFKT